MRSPGLLKEYYKNPQATAEVKDADGWFHTGDAGFFDADGHLKIIDRAKDVGKLRRRHAVRAQVHREQAQVLSVHQGSGGLRRRARQGLRVHQHRLRGGRQLGRAAQPAVRRLHRPGAEARGATSWCASASRRSTPTSPPTPELAGTQIQPLPDPAQGARRRRRRADAHAQGAPRLHRRASTRCWSTRCTAASASSTSRPQVQVRGRPHRHASRADLKIVDAKTFAGARRRRRDGVPHERATQDRRRRSSTVENISLAFGGVKALHRHQLRRARARGARDHRPERRRQELDAQLHQRRLPAAAGHDHAFAARPSST